MKKLINFIILIFYKSWSHCRKLEEPIVLMTVKLTLNTKLLNTRKEKSLSSLKVEEDTTTNKEDSVDKRNQYLRRKPKLLKKSL